MGKVAFEVGVDGSRGLTGRQIPCVLCAGHRPRMGSWGGAGSPRAEAVPRGPSHVWPVALGVLWCWVLAGWERVNWKAY